MGNRFGELVKLDGEKIRAELRAHGITQTMLQQSIGISNPSMTKAINGLQISTEIEDKITKGLFKEPGYFRAKERAVTQTATNEGLKDLSEMLTDYLEDIKQSNEQILSQLKTLTTLQARLLALWEGEKHEPKDGNSSVLKKTS